MCTLMFPMHVLKYQDASFSQWLNAKEFWGLGGSSNWADFLTWKIADLFQANTIDYTDSSFRRVFEVGFYVPTLIYFAFNYIYLPFIPKWSFLHLLFRCSLINFWSNLQIIIDLKIFNSLSCQAYPSKFFVFISLEITG